MSDFLLLFFWILSILGLLYGLWHAIPIFYGMPWTPSPRKRIRKALRMARLREGETLYDLGSGDGRVLILAAKEFNARAVGVEINPLHCLYARIVAWIQGVSPRVRLRCKNLYHADFSDADVVYLYFTSPPNKEIQERLQTSLRKGARVVALSFDFTDWQPDSLDKRSLIFVYTMPPKSGGLLAYLLRKEEEPFILDD